MNRIIVLLTGLLLAATIGSAFADVIPEPIREGYDKCVGPDGWVGPNRTTVIKALTDCQKQANVVKGKRHYIVSAQYYVLVPDDQPPPPPTPVDCAGAWSDYVRVPGSETACVDGTRSYQESRTFTVTTPPANGGAACPTSPDVRVQTEGCVLPSPTPLPPTSAPVLSVSPNSRYLRIDGQPWYWLGDTAWLLSLQTKPTITQYLEDRAAKGVKLVHGPIITPRRPPSYNGVLKDRTAAILEFEPSKIEVIDWAVQEAGRLGMLITLAPVWGPDNDTYMPQVARHVEFVTMLVKRYANQAHVIWIPAGEYHKVMWSNPPEPWPDGVPPHVKDTTAEIDATAKARYQAIFDAIRANKHPASQIIWHPDGWKKPSRDWAVAGHLGYMLQPSGSIGETVRGITEERASPTVKPVVSGEGDYENDNDAGPWSQRQFAWHTAFSGGAGFTYGHGAVWDFDPGWDTVLNAEGFGQVFGPHRAYMTRHHRESNVPAQNLVVNNGSLFPAADSYISALRSSDSKTLHVYTGNGRNIQLNTGALAAGSLSGTWFDPRTGVEGAPFSIARGSNVTIDPPGAFGAGNDWVLTIRVSTQTTGVLSVGVVLPTENEDGTPVRPPLTVLLSRKLSTSGVSIEQQATYSNGVATIADVAAGVYFVKSRVRDADSQVSEYSSEVQATVAGQADGGEQVTIFTNLKAQWDVNTRGRSDNSFYEWVNGVVSTLSGGTSLDTSNNFDGINLNGSTGYVRHSIPVGLSSTFADGDYTMAVRVKLDTVNPGWMNFIGAYDSADTQTRAEIGSESGTGEAHATHRAQTGTAVYLGSSAGLDDGAEHVVVLRKTGTDFELWVDNTKVDDQTVTATTVGTLDRITFGQQDNASVQSYLDGTIKWAAIYDASVADEVIAELSASENPFVRHGVSTILHARLWRKDINNSPANRDLTQLGTLDWAYWGRTAATDFDQKSGGTIFNAVEKLTGSEGSIGRAVPSGGTKYPACSWTNGTPTGSHSGERDNVYITTSTAGWGMKMTTDALGSGRKRLVFGVAGYQADMIIRGSISDASSAPYASGIQSMTTDEVKSYEVSFVVEPSDPAATFTVALEARDTDGNVGFQYAYAEDWPYELIVHDTFTGSDNTALESRAPSPVNGLAATPTGDGTTSGSYAGGADIVSNQAKFNTASETIVYDIGSHEAIIFVDMALASTDVNRNYISFSRTDKDNLFSFNPRQQDSDWNSYRRDAGVQTTISGGNAKTWGTSKTYCLELRRVGTLLQFKSDGDVLLHYTSASQHTTATKVGLGVAGQTGAGIYDNLEIWTKRKVNISAADTIQFSPSGVIRSRQPIAATDTITISEAGDLKGKGRLLGVDSITVSEAANLKGKGRLLGADGLVISEAAAIRGRVNISAADTVTISELGNLKGQGRLLAVDTLTISEQGVLKGRGRLIGADTITLSEVAVVRAKGRLLGADTITFSEQGAIRGKGPLAAADTITFSDNANLTPRSTLSAAIGLVFSEAANLKGRGRLLAADTITFSEAALLRGKGRLIGADTITISEAATLRGRGRLLGVDVLTFSEAGNLKGRGRLLAVDTITISEAANLKGRGRLLAADTITVSEAANLKGRGRLIAVDTITFSEAANLKARGRLIGAVDTITFSEVAALRAKGRLIGADTITLSEAATLRGKGRLLGADTITISEAGNLKGRGRLITSTIVQFTPTATISTIGELNGVGDIVFSQAALLHGKAALAGNVVLALSTMGQIMGEAGLRSVVQLNIDGVADLDGYGRLIGVATIDLLDGATAQARMPVQGSTILAFADNATLHDASGMVINYVIGDMQVQQQIDADIVVVPVQGGTQSLTDVVVG